MKTYMQQFLHHMCTSYLFSFGISEVLIRLDVIINIETKAGHFFSKMLNARLNTDSIMSLTH